MGERVEARLKDAGVEVLGAYAVPGSVEAIAPLVAQIQIDSEARGAKSGMIEVHVFHSRPLAASLYEPVGHAIVAFACPWRWVASCSRRC